MFKFLFGKSKEAPVAKAETQRETVTRCLDEINAVVAGMDPKPRVHFDPNTGAIGLDLPEQMPDEALALPAPEQPKTEEEAAPQAENLAEPTEAQTAEEADKPKSDEKVAA